MFLREFVSLPVFLVALFSLFGGMVLFCFTFGARFCVWFRHFWGSLCCLCFIVFPPLWFLFCPLITSFGIVFCLIISAWKKHCCVICLDLVFKTNCCYLVWFCENFNVCLYYQIPKLGSIRTCLVIMWVKLNSSWFFVLSLLMCK